MFALITTVTSHFTAVDKSISITPGIKIQMFQDMYEMYVN